MESKYRNIGIVLITIILYFAVVFSGKYAMGILFLACWGIAINVLCLKFNSILLAELILTLLVFQNLIIGLAAHWSGKITESILLMTQVPFLMIAVTAVFQYFKRYENEWINALLREDLSFCVLVLFLCLEFFTSDAGITSKMTNIRNMICFYLSYMIGRLCINDKEKLRRYCKLLVGLCIFITVIGLWMMQQPIEFWEAIGVQEVYIAKNSPCEPGSFPGQFHTTLFSEWVIRMASIYYEPVNLAYLLALGSLVALTGEWTCNRWRSVLASIIIFIGLVVTYGKGGYAIFGLCLVCGLINRLWYDFVPFRTRNMRKNFMLVIGVVGSFLVISWYLNQYGGSVSQHVWGIEQTFASVLDNPWGFGLGNGGNAAMVFGDVDEYSWLSAGGETAIMSYFYQLGVVGIVIFMICLISIARKLLKAVDFAAPMWKLSNLLMYMPFVMLVVGLMQDNTFSPQCITPIFLLLGGLETVLTECRGSGCENRIKMRNAG